MDKDRAGSSKDPDGTIDDSGGKLLSEDLVKAIQEAVHAEIAKVVPAPSHPPAPLGSSASGTDLFSLHALFILACVRGAREGARRPLPPRLSARRRYFSHSHSLPGPPFSSSSCLPPSLSPLVSAPLCSGFPPHAGSPYSIRRPTSTGLCLSSSLASYPGLLRRRVKAWYLLFAHARVALEFHRRRLSSYMFAVRDEYLSIFLAVREALLFAIYSDDCIVSSFLEALSQ